MRNRCINSGSSVYAYYGGRGISMTSAWNRYETFRDWAHQSGYEAGKEIDRINNDGDYTPDNCRWVTRLENMRNTRVNRLLTAFNETKCLTEWMEDTRCSVQLSTLWARLNSGWGVEQAIATPVQWSIS